MPMKEKNDQSIERRGDYPHIPDHSDLRGFSYRAPTAFDYRDEERKKKGLLGRFFEKLGLGGARS